MTDWYPSVATRRLSVHFFLRNRLLVISSVLAPVVLMGIWSGLQTFSELNRSYGLTGEVNEIQWRGHQIVDELITINGLLALALATKSREYDNQIELQARFLDVNISALLTQPFLASLISKKDIDYLGTVTDSVDTRLLTGLTAPDTDYARLLTLIDEFLPEVRRITTLTNTASYVRAHASEQAKDYYLENFTWALFAASLLFVAAWLLLLYRSKAEYNDSVRQFSLLFSHMTVTRINGLNLWAQECLSPDEYPDALLLEKARNRIENLTVMSQWLSHVAFPRMNEEMSPLVPVAHIVNELSNRTGQPKPVLLIEQPAAAISVPEAHYHLILQELVSNAQDALIGVDRPEITIRAVVNRTVIGRKRLTISVSDNGPGMSGSQIAQAVKPFYSTKGEASGHSGLGLYGCMEMVRTMRGKFSISSSPGRGTTMKFSCPISLNT